MTGFAERREVYVQALQFMRGLLSLETVNVEGMARALEIRPHDQLAEITNILHGAGESHAALGVAAPEVGMKISIFMGIMIGAMLERRGAIQWKDIECVHVPEAGP